MYVRVKPVLLCCDGLLSSMFPCLLCSAARNTLCFVVTNLQHYKYRPELEDGEIQRVNPGGLSGRQVQKGARGFTPHRCIACHGNGA